MAAVRRTQESPPAPWLSLVVGLAAFVLYLALLSPVPADKDSGEFTLVLATLGLAHPTGYPLYTILGSLFVRAAHALEVPWVPAANAFSALGGAVAMGALHAATARLLTRRLDARRAGYVALLPVGTFALNPAWTVETTIAEVNSWHLAWVAIVAWVTWSAVRRLREHLPTPGVPRRVMFGWGAVVGLGLAHHATAVCFAVPLAVALATVAWRLRGAAGGRAAIVAALAGIALPLASYGYVAWRAWHPALAQWPELEPRFASVVSHITGAQYRIYLGQFAPSPGQRHVLAAYVYPWLLAAVAGSVWAAWRGGAVRRALAAGVVLQGAYCFAYGVPDPSAYFLPPIAIGLALLTVALAEVAWPRAAARTLVAAACALVLASGTRGWSVARERTRTFVQADALVRQMWDSIPRQPAFLVWDDDMANRLRILQDLDHQHPELVIVQPRHLSHPGPRRQFAAAYGFDPLGDLRLPPAMPASDEAHTRLLVAAVIDDINRHTPLPVIEFRPDLLSVRLLRKPGAAPGTPPRERRQPGG